MMPITIEELEQKLKEWENTIINLVLEGMIATVIKIENAKVEFTSNEIVIYSQINEENIVILNRHQIMKMEKQNERCLSVKFDGLLSIAFIQLS